jgi:hypothetical protein
MSTSDVSDIKVQLLAISKRAELVARRVGPKLIAMRPEPGVWSVAECLTHLRMTVEAYMPIWQEACRDAFAAGQCAPAKPFKLDFWGRFLVWFLEPPPKLRFPAPRKFRPKLEGNQDGALAAFLASQDNMLKLITAAGELPLDGIIIRSAFGRYIRYSLWSSF